MAQSIQVAQSGRCKKKAVFCNICRSEKVTSKWAIEKILLTWRTDPFNHHDNKDKHHQRAFLLQRGASNKDEKLLMYESIFIRQIDTHQVKHVALRPCWFIQCLSKSAGYVWKAWSLQHRLSGEKTEMIGKFMMDMAMTMLKVKTNILWKKFSKFFNHLWSSNKHFSVSFIFTLFLHEKWWYKRKLQSTNGF